MCFKPDWNLRFAFFEKFLLLCMKMVKMVKKTPAAQQDIYEDISHPIQTDETGVSL